MRFSLFSYRYGDSVGGQTLQRFLPLICVCHVAESTLSVWRLNIVCVCPIRIILCSSSKCSGSDDRGKTPPNVVIVV